MSFYVVKFGGSSVATTSRIKKASEIVSRIISNGNKVVIVTSAMQGVTNQLIDFAKIFHDSPINREYDAIISSGEQVAAGLFALCLSSVGIKSKSMLGWQIPIKTSNSFSQAIIKSINAKKVLDAVFEKDITPVIAGFQGISDRDEITTIGRGGSDATACALAYALNADECFIYTDVDGIYTADPRIVLNSKRIEKISYNEMLELASCGARVLQSRSVLIAKQCNVKLRVLSSFSETGETIVTSETVYIPKVKKIAGIAHNMSSCMIKIFGEANQIQIFEMLYDNNIKLDLISVSENLISFLIQKPYLGDLKLILENEKITFDVDNDIGVVSIVGDGVKTDQSIFKKILSIINTKRIKLKSISFSDISISLIIPFQQTELLVNEIHHAFFE
ncbi:MAG: aspartate kinase [Holosporales bacterium]|jgi:aspartate kinase|nr:aspartate kinase [Holosporales bacterium]